MDQPKPGLGVEILPPDKTLLAKVGAHNIAALFNKGAEVAAQSVLDATTGDFRTEMLAEFQQLSGAFWSMAEAQADQPSTLKEITDLAFSIKAKAGLAEYKLVSALSKSLYLYCEACPMPLSGKSRDVIDWHIQSIGKILKLDIKGDGGEIGEALNAELAKLTTGK